MPRGGMPGKRHGCWCLLPSSSSLPTPLAHPPTALPLHAPPAHHHRTLVHASGAAPLAWCTSRSTNKTCSTPASRCTERAATARSLNMHQPAFTSANHACAWRRDEAGWQGQVVGDAPACTPGACQGMLAHEASWHGGASANEQAGRFEQRSRQRAAAKAATQHRCRCLCCPATRPTAAARRPPEPCAG